MMAVAEAQTGRTFVLGCPRSSNQFILLEHGDNRPRPNADFLHFWARHASICGMKI